jgi:hypothetical protein
MFLELGSSESVFSGFSHLDCKRKRKLQISHLLYIHGGGIVDQLSDTILLIVGEIVAIAIVLTYVFINRASQKGVETVVHRSYVQEHSDRPLTPRKGSQRPSSFEPSRPDMRGSTSGFLPTSGKKSSKKEKSL